MSKYLNKSKSEMLTEVVRPKKIKDKKLIWKLNFIKRANEKIAEAKLATRFTASAKPFSFQQKLNES